MSISLTVQKRDVIGKKVKALYRDGKVLGNVFGRGKESVAVMAEYETIRKVTDEAGKNHPIELTIDGEGNHLVLIKNIDHDPVKGRIRHVEFHMVNRNEKVEAEVPVELIGTAPAVLVGNIVITLNDTVIVEANPTSLPDHLEADAEMLKEPDDIITLADIKLPADVEFITELDTPLFKVEVPRSQVEEVETEEEVIDAADVPSDHGAEAPEEAPEK